MLALMPTLTFASVIPSGPDVISGHITFDAGDKILGIRSTDSKNVIAWDDFSVSKDASVFFDSNAYLNIVQSDKASVIDGVVYGSRGSSIYLFNPNGITVGKNANLQVTISSSPPQDLKRMISITLLITVSLILKTAAWAK